MATVMAPPQAVNGRGAEKKPLWGDIELPIIVGTGAFGSGKTIFGLTICPGSQTLVYDNEGSSLSYRSLGFDHVDMSSELLKVYPNGFSALQRWEWWRKDILSRGKTGKYRVAVVDPASELEDGLADYVMKHLNDYDLTLEQARKSKGLFWGAVKREWKLTLDMLRACYDTVYLTVHLRDEFVGNSPSGKKEPKGKETLWELASLFLWFDKKGEKPPAPGANVEKSRVTKWVFNEEAGEMEPVSVLPDRLPVATPRAIREYISHPVGSKKLGKNERRLEHELTEEEKLRIQNQIAENQRAASEAELTRLQLMQQAAAAAEQRRQSLAPQGDNSAAVAQAQANKTAARAHVPIKQSMLESICKQLSVLFGNDKCKWNEWLKPKLEELGVSSSKELSDSQGDGILAELCKLVADQQAAAIASTGAALLAENNMGEFSKNEPAADDPPFDVPTPQAQEPPAVVEQEKPLSQLPSPAPVSEAQIAKFKMLVQQASVSKERIVVLLSHHGKSRFGELKTDQADEVLRQLEGIVNLKTQQADGTAKEPEPPASTKPELIERLQAAVAATKWSVEEQRNWLKKNGGGAKSIREAPVSKVVALVEELTAVSLAFNGGVPGN